MEEQGVQRAFAPSSICFGCGPANERGLRINSTRCDGGLEALVRPAPEHQAFPGMIAGGIIGTILDCHGNWTAAIALMDERGDERPPTTVTASYKVDLKRPTPADADLHVVSTVVSIDDPWVEVEMILSADNKVRAKGTGRFVSVTEGHPAYHRWE